MVYIQGGAEETVYIQSGAEETVDIQGGTEKMVYIQGGAVETHVFHIRITLSIFNIKILITQKRSHFNAFLKHAPNYVLKVMSVR